MQLTTCVFCRSQNKNQRLTANIVTRAQRAQRNVLVQVTGAVSAVLSTPSRHANSCKLAGKLGFSSVAELARCLAYRCRAIAGHIRVKRSALAGPAGEEKHEGLKAVYQLFATGQAGPSKVHPPKKDHCSVLFCFVLL